MKNRKPNRLKGFDYSNIGPYFITICARGCADPFGAVRDGRMVLSAMGRICAESWRAIPDHEPGVILDEFVVMPDHFHGIIQLPDDDAVGSVDLPVDLPVGARHALPLPLSQPLPQRDEPGARRYHGLPVVIGSFKSAVTRAVNRQFPDSGFRWQRSFHDRIIRDGGELRRIRDYVNANPANWSDGQTIPTFSVHGAGWRGDLTNEQV